MAKKKSSSTAKKVEQPLSDRPTGLVDCEECGAPAGSFHHPDCVFVIPVFLRRTGPKKTTEQIKLILGETRDWVMPSKKHRTLENYMPISKINPRDPSKPVQVNIVTLQGSQARLFDNLEEFEKWYNPNEYVLSGQIADDSITIVTAETVEARKAAPESAEVKRKAAQIIKERERQEKREEKEKRKAERAAGKPPGEKRAAGGSGMTGSIAVTVAGKSYGTIKTALKALGIPDSERKGLRSILIKEGKATLKGHVFTLRDGSTAKTAPAPVEKATEKKAPEKKAPEKKAPEKKAPEKKATEKKAPEKKAPPAKKPPAVKKAQAKKKGGRK
jgi:hypothetical protein